MSSPAGGPTRPLIYSSERRAAIARTRLLLLIARLTPQQRQVIQTLGETDQDVLEITKSLSVSPTFALQPIKVAAEFYGVAVDNVPSHLRQQVRLAGGFPTSDQLLRDSLTEHPASRSSKGHARRAVPKAIQDTAGYEDLKPDPSTARTMAELRTLLREFWSWADEPSSRRVAAASGGAFSHSTAAKLLADDPRVPMRLEYVVGVIAGCGGDEGDQQRWATAYRLLKKRSRTRPLHAVRA